MENRSICLKGFLMFQPKMGLSFSVTLTFGSKVKAKIF